MLEYQLRMFNFVNKSHTIAIEYDVILKNLARYSKGRTVSKSTRHKTEQQAWEKLSLP